MWYKSKYLYIDTRNPLKTINQIKGVFKLPKLKFKIGRTWYPPVWWWSNPYPIHIVSTDVGWKDKYDTPRFEHAPYIWIYLFGLNLIWYWTIEDEDCYWEQVLWYLYYYENISYGRLSSPDINKAKESWPWQDYDTKVSTWNDEFLINGNSKGSN